MCISGPHSLVPNQAAMAVTETKIVQYITDAPSKVTFLHLQRHFYAAHRIKPTALKAMVAGLIRSGDLRYTSFFGTSYLEISYDQPRCVSEHIVLKPAKTNWSAMADHQVVSLEEFLQASHLGSLGIAHCHPQERKGIRELELTGDYTILVGPEGDFSEEELRDALGAGFLPIHLGDSRLRTETAALYITTAISLLHS